MSEVSRKLGQCRKPSGDLGKAVAGEMNVSHFELTGWGLNKIDIKDNFEILDVGCGGGRTVNRMAKMIQDGKVIGVDYSKDCVEWTKQLNSNMMESGKVEVYNASVEHLPFDDNRFDLVTAVETIYFWPNLDKSLREIKRILKQEGIFIIINEMYMDKSMEKEYEDYKKNMDLYTPEELKKIILSSGYNKVDMEIDADKHWICYVCRK